MKSLNTSNQDILILKKELIDWLSLQKRIKDLTDGEFAKDIGVTLHLWRFYVKDPSKLYVPKFLSAVRCHYPEKTPEIIKLLELNHNDQE